MRDIVDLKMECLPPPPPRPKPTPEDTLPPPTTVPIAFTSNRDGNAQIYVMNPDGSKIMDLPGRQTAEKLRHVYEPKSISPQE